MENVNLTKKGAFSNIIWVIMIGIVVAGIVFATNNNGLVAAAFFGGLALFVVGGGLLGKWGKRRDTSRSKRQRNELVSVKKQYSPEVNALQAKYREAMSNNKRNKRFGL